MSPQTKRWLKGLWASAIKGGCHAVAPTGTVSLLDPADWGPHNNLGKFMTLVGTTFTVSSVIALTKYLSDSPVPPDSDTTPPIKPT